MAREVSRRYRTVMETEAPSRPWAAGIGIVLLGLLVASVANVAALSAAGSGAAVRIAGALGYGAGLVVAGAGVHRLLWYAARPRPRWVRLLGTALVTPPVFAVAGVVVGVFLTLLHARLAF